MPIQQAIAEHFWPDSKEQPCKKEASFNLRADDGKGIEPKVLTEGGIVGHWGLRGIRERADRIGARLEVWSEPANGTEVQLLVPDAIAYENLRESNRVKLARKVKRRAQR